MPEETHFAPLGVFGYCLTRTRFLEPVLKSVRFIQRCQGTESLFRRESRTLYHPFADDWLWLDIDLTPLPASKHAEASTKGKLGAKKTFLGGNYWRVTGKSSPRVAAGDTRRHWRAKSVPMADWNYVPMTVGWLQ